MEEKEVSSNGSSGRKGSLVPEEELSSAAEEGESSDGIKQRKKMQQILCVVSFLSLSQMNVKRTRSG